jgi:hypothetical protein
MRLPQCYSGSFVSYLIEAIRLRLIEAQPLVNLQVSLLHSPLLADRSRLTDKFANS